MKAQGRSREGIRKARRTKPAAKTGDVAIPEQSAPLNRRQRRAYESLQRCAYSH